MTTIMDHTAREATVRALNTEYIASILRGDVAWFRDHLAEEFVCIESDASLVDKPSFLRRTAEPPTLISYNLGDVEISTYGDCSLVRATGYWVAKDGRRGMSRYVDVYAWVGNAWKVVSAQITRPPATE